MSQLFEQVRGVLRCPTRQSPEVVDAAPKSPALLAATYAITASADSTAHMWSLESGQLVRKFEGHMGALWSCCLSPDKTRLFTTSQDGTAKMWDVSTGECLRTYRGQRGQPNWACVTPDMEFLFTAVNDCTAKVWHVESGRFLTSLQHEGCVCSVVMSPDGRFLFTAADDRLGRKWSIPAFAPVCVFYGRNRKGLYSCFLSADGSHFFTASHDGTVKMFDAQHGGEALRTFQGLGGACNVVTSPVDSCVFVGRDDAGCGEVQIFAQSGELLRTLEGHDRGVSAMWVTPDGKRLLTCSWDQTAKVWETSSGRLLLTYRGHASLVQGIVCC